MRLYACENICLFFFISTLKDERQTSVSSLSPLFVRKSGKSGGTIPSVNANRSEKYTGTDDSFSRNNLSKKSNLRNFIIATTASTYTFFHRTEATHAQLKSRPATESCVVTETKASSRKKILTPLLVVGTVTIGGRAIVVRKDKKKKRGDEAFNEIIDTGKPPSQSKASVSEQNPKRTANFDALVSKSEEIRIRTEKLSHELDKAALSHEESKLEREDNEGFVEFETTIEGKATSLMDEKEVPVESVIVEEGKATALTDEKEVPVVNSIVGDASRDEDVPDPQASPSIAYEASKDISIDEELVNVQVKEEIIDIRAEEPVAVNPTGEDAHLDIEITQTKIGDESNLNENDNTTADMQEEIEEMELSELKYSDNKEDYTFEELSEEEDSVEELSDEDDTVGELSEAELAKKYAGIEDPGERAFQILKDLGMIEITPDPDEKDFQ